MADDDGEFNVEEEESEDNVSDDGSEHSTGSYDSDQIFNFLEGADGTHARSFDDIKPLLDDDKRQLTRSELRKLVLDNTRLFRYPIEDINNDTRITKGELD